MLEDIMHNHVVRERLYENRISPVSALSSVASYHRAMAPSERFQKLAQIAREYVDVTLSGDATALTLEHLTSIGLGDGSHFVIAWMAAQGDLTGYWPQSKRLDGGRFISLAANTLANVKQQVFGLPPQTIWIPSLRMQQEFDEFSRPYLSDKSISYDCLNTEALRAILAEVILIQFRGRVSDVSYRNIADIRVCELGTDKGVPASQIIYELAKRTFEKRYNRERNDCSVETVTGSV